MSRPTKRAEQQATWRELMSTYARVSEALERSLQASHGISFTEFEVLQRLVESPEGYRRMQELASEVHLSQSALSRLVGRLETAELVEREICKTDRRGIYATITDSGRSVHRKAEITHRHALASTLPAEAPA